MLRVRTDHAHNIFAANNFTLVTNSFDGRFYFHSLNSLTFNFHLHLYVIRPLERSYGESSTFTLSPGIIRIKCMRILPAKCAKTIWPLSSLTLNWALGNASSITPSTSIESSLAMLFCQNERPRRCNC